MVTKYTLLSFVALTILLGSIGQSSAAEPEPTVMAVGEMCGGCVRRITAKLEPIEGIARVECSIEKKAVWVVPTSGVRLSPQALWDAMAEIGKTPVQLTGPNGTFTERPSF